MNMKKQIQWRSRITFLATHDSLGPEAEGELHIVFNAVLVSLESDLPSNYRHGSRCHRDDLRCKLKRTLAEGSVYAPVVTSADGL